MNRIIISLTALILVVGCSSTPQPHTHDLSTLQTENGLIPRRLIFGNPEVSSVKLSPDGRWVTYLAPRDGVMNIWLAPRDKIQEARPLTRETKRGIRFYDWAYNSQDLYYLQDKNGDENYHVYGVDIATQTTSDLTPFREINATIVAHSPRHPDKILVGINNDDKKYHDVHELDLRAGVLTLLEKNKDQYAEFFADNDLNIRLASKMNDRGDVVYYRRGTTGMYAPIFTTPQEDTMSSRIDAFDPTGQFAYLIDSRGRDTGVFVQMDLRTLKKTTLSMDRQVNAYSIIYHPTRLQPQAVSYQFERNRWDVIDASVKEDFKAIEKKIGSDFTIDSRTLDDNHWIIARTRDAGPVTYHLYDKKTRSLTLLMSSRPALEKQPLVAMHPQIIRSRDGLKLVSYLSLPATVKGQRPSQPLPMVLWVHGGPWVRDSWGFHRYHQWLANRGYAVLSVNYRGSGGFSKSFVNAGDREWGRKMHNDLIDATDWAIREKIADPKRIAIAGGSYGGYATLVGITMTPEKFACGVDIVGPSNLNTLLASIPPYWAPSLEMFYKRVGDPRTEEGKKFLDSRSPLSYVHQIKRPLLVIQGANDPRVKKTEADQIAAAMKAKNIPVTYVVFPDEGHGFNRPENNISATAVAEQFLSTCLSGKAESIGDAFNDSSIEFVEGKVE